MLKDNDHYCVWLYSTYEDIIAIRMDFCCVSILWKVLPHVEHYYHMSTHILKYMLHVVWGCNSLAETFLEIQMCVCYDVVVSGIVVKITTIFPFMYWQCMLIVVCGCSLLQASNWQFNCLRDTAWKCSGNFHNISTVYPHHGVQHMLDVSISFPPNTFTIISLYIYICIYKHMCVVNKRRGFLIARVL